MSRAVGAMKFLDGRRDLWMRVAVTLCDQPEHEGRQDK
jgi:hypothetical protein